MTTLTIQLPEEETKLFKQLLKKLNGKILSQPKIPNKATVEAMSELKAGKGIKFENVEQLFNSI